nr:PTS glucose transporter subunit IIA [Nocardia cyriacigeorgica]
MTVPVLAPLPGRVLTLADVPDPVFAGQLVGSGVAIDPVRDRGALDVLAPIAGTIVKLHPHAFVILGADGTGVLTHLGIDTVKLAGAGFVLLAAEGDDVDAGTPIVRFDPAEIDGTGYSAICPIVVMDSARDSVDPATVGTDVETGATLFVWTPIPR